MTWLWGYCDPTVYVGFTRENQIGSLALQRNYDISPAMLYVIVATCPEGLDQIGIVVKKI